MIYCLFCIAIFLYVFIDTFFIKKDRMIHMEKWTIINGLLLLLAVILFTDGLLVNVKYANDCMSNGKKIDVMIIRRNFPSGRGFRSWFEYEAETIEDNRVDISFCTSEYYKKNDVVTCFVWKKEGKDEMVIAEGSKQCTRGNELLTGSAVLWMLTTMIYGLRHDLFDFGK